jgi:peptidoglycan/xylan/chitin deacetylase (PgdA/CDA1 family)
MRRLSVLIVALVATCVVGSGAIAAPSTQTPQGPKRVPVSEDEIFRGPPDRPYVSLVINAGAGFTPAAEILDILASRNVRTTFFLLGYWAEKNPDLVRRMRDEGHEVASHGHRIFDLTSVSDAEVIADLETADAVISAITGQTTRPLWSPSAGYRDARVRRIAAQLGYRPILWSHDSGDWRVDTTPEQVRRLAMNGAEPGAIVVFHLDSAHSRTATAAVFGEIIDAYRARGLEPVTITELVGQ